ncbi:uncharacterized protein ALTATR162_LOCUS923 [Alternaria atra]|jgi:hypothetical protein|uniref:ABM domain-containing protein n=1 Tax=Alternaria atra TaxID=119953 RepID=A0A8J2HSP0_9PLEO|nr:uncharacterized protein ALTATR162_LOCUS923 [Alternaria atra]CAG5141391.1 unnamed protein product [Alternaria atra]
MTVTQIIHFRAPSASEADSQAHTAVKALKGAKAPENYVLGTQIQDKRNLQLTSEWHDPKAESSKEADKYRETVIKTLGNPEKMFHVSFKDGDSAFDNGGPLSSPLVEFVQIYFPASKVTEDFRSKIEKEFKKFDDMCAKVVKGNGGLAYGWVLEEQEHKDVKEKAKCFFVSRGWEGMQYFEDVIKTEEYKEAVQILLGWQAPWDMWHVKREF